MSNMDRLFLYFALTLRCTCVSSSRKVTGLEGLESPQCFHQKDFLLYSKNPHVESCGPVEHICKCRNETADCFQASFSPKRLGSFLSFNRTITKLRIQLQVGEPIKDRRLFQNVENLTMLEIVYIGYGLFENLHRQLFHPLRRLRKLCIDMPLIDLHKFSLEPILQVQTLEFLKISRFESLPDDAFNTTYTSNLQFLVLSENTIRSLNMRTFASLKNLKILFVESAFIATLTEWKMPSLEILNLRNNDISSFPRFTLCIHDYDFDYFYYLCPSLRRLILSENKITHIPRLPSILDPLDECPVMLPNLTTLIFESNPYHFFDGHWPNVLKDTALKILDFSNMNKHSPTELFLRSDAFSAFRLEILYLSDIGLNFPSQEVDQGVFDNSPQLSELHLDGNSFAGITDAKFHQLFSPLTSLKILNLGNTKLERFTQAMASTLTQLEVLFLHDNKLAVLPDGMFDSYLDLRTLRLDINSLRTVSKGMFSRETGDRLTSLNLSLNPFECDCPLLWFRQWLVKERTKFDLDNVHSRYTCRNMNDASLTSLPLNIQPCLLSREASILIIVCVAVLMLTMMLTTLFFRYRWHFRLIMYEAFRGQQLAKWKQRDAGDFQFDLFVSYDSDDQTWVHDHLMQELEDGLGLRLCVHQRDFIPGKNIADNIVDCLAASKRVLAIFSPSFAENPLCQFELELCLSHVIDNGDIMVVVWLQNVPSRDMSGAMLALMKTTTYIEWGVEPEAEASFWRRMILALNDILPGGRH